MCFMNQTLYIHTYIHRHAWKHSKKDFFVLVVTLTMVFVFNTGIGLAIGSYTTSLCAYVLLIIITLMVLLINRC